MQDKEFEEDQFHTDRDVLGAGEDNREMRDNPAGDADSNPSADPAAIYTSDGSTMQTPEEHRKDQNTKVREEDSKITGTPPRDETEGYDDKGEAGV